MQKLTPDWEETANLFIAKLDEVAEELDLSIELGADPMAAVNEAIEELQPFLNAIINGGLA